MNARRIKIVRTIFIGADDVRVRTTDSVVPGEFIDNVQGYAENIRDETMYRLGSRYWDNDVRVTVELVEGRDIIATA